MNNNTAKQFKAIAKARGIKGYYKLRKAEVIQRFGSDKISRTEK